MAQYQDVQNLTTAHALSNPNKGSDALTVPLCIQSARLTVVFSAALSSAGGIRREHCSTVTSVRHGVSAHGEEWRAEAGVGSGAGENCYLVPR